MPCQCVESRNEKYISNHNMEMLLTLVAFRKDTQPVTDGFPSQRAGDASFGVNRHLLMDQRWLVTLYATTSMWRHCCVFILDKTS